MVVVWIERIENQLSRPVIMYHCDPLIKPIIKGEKYSGKPIILEPGFSDEVGWFNIPWRKWGDLMIDIDMPIRVVVGPHGPDGDKDWLQLYHYTGEALLDHWQELGASTWWEFFSGGKQIRMNLTFAETRGTDARHGHDVELMHFIIQDSYNVYSVGDGSAEKENETSATGAVTEFLGFCVGKSRPNKRQASKSHAGQALQLDDPESHSSSPERKQSQAPEIFDMAAADDTESHDVEKIYENVAWCKGDILQGKVVSKDTGHEDEATGGDKEDAADSQDEVTSFHSADSQDERESSALRKEKSSVPRESIQSWRSWKRIDPADGDAYTLDEMYELHKGKYTLAQIEEYYKSCAVAEYQGPMEME